LLGNELLSKQPFLGASFFLHLALPSAHQLNQVRTVSHLVERYLAFKCLSDKHVFFAVIGASGKVWNVINTAPCIFMFSLNLVQDIKKN
jgi:hypothetical protein